MGHHFSHQPTYLPLKIKKLIEALTIIVLVNIRRKHCVIALLIKSYYDMV